MRLARPPTARRSIRRRLLVLLLSVLVLLIGAAAGVTYRAASRAANDAYDRSLLDPALELAKNVRTEAGEARLDLPLKAQETLMFDQTDEVFFEVRAPTGTLVAGSLGLPRAPDLAPGQHAFLDGEYLGRPVRMAAYRTDGGYLVQVGETLRKRQRLAWEMLIAELIPTLLIGLASVALTWFGVQRVLAPLDRVRKELLTRSARDLHALSDEDVPEEIAPVVAAFNRVLAQLREGSALQKRFLANAAHQLRTPLAGLQMHLELLLRREHTGEAAGEIERLHQATVRAGHVTKQLLALTKADSAAGGAFTPQDVDLYTLAGTAARQWVPEAITRKVDLGFSLAHVTVQGDPLLLSDLLDNLVDNALHYTGHGGSVTVRCGERAGEAFLSVEDTGPGIPVTERDKVLERFYRMPGTRGDGSGLGLAIVKEVADRHGARLTISTPESGRGTAITVTFPAARARDDAAALPVAGVRRTTHGAIGEGTVASGTS